MAELFAKRQQKLGLVPNVLVAYAHNPEKLCAVGMRPNPEYHAQSWGR